MSKIMVIDDDLKLSNLIKQFLEPHKYRVVCFDNPINALSKIKTQRPDLIILDIMMPEMDGFQVLKKIRETLQTPVIMLTARGELSDKIVGLELGADDYLSKPFEPRELVARIQSILRRLQAKRSSGVKKIGGLSIDFHKLEVTVDEKPAGLTSSEFECLALLVKNSGKVLNRDQIIEQLREIEEVADVFETIGTHDMMVKLKAANFEKIREIVSWNIQKLPKVRSTSTLIKKE